MTLVAGHSVQQLTIVKIDVSHDDIHLLTLIHGFFFLTNHQQLIQHFPFVGIGALSTNVFSWVQKLLVDGNLGSDAIT